MTPQVRRREEPLPQITPARTTQVREVTPDVQPVRAPRDHAVRAEDRAPSFTPARNDVARADDLEKAPQLDRAPSRPEGSELYAHGPARAVGLRSELGNDRRTYAPAALPDVGHDLKAPEKPGLLRRLFEALFGWIGPVSTDSERLRAYGKKIADERGSDLEAFLLAHQTTVGAKGPRNPDASRQALIDDLSARIGSSSRAAAIVDSMLARHDENRKADAERAGDLPIPEPKDSASARTLASSYYATERTAQAMGKKWEARLDRAIKDPVGARDPYVIGNPDDQDRAKLWVRHDRVTTVAYLMALERGGDLKNVPESAVDELLGAQRNSLVTPTAVAEAVTAMQNMPAAERKALLALFDRVPEDKRTHLYALYAREHVAFSSSDPSERAASMRRLELAADQMSKMNAAELDAAFTRGTLGLEASSVKLELKDGDKKVAVDLPVYFHPAVKEADREKYLGLLKESYEHLSYPMMKRLMDGEADTAGTFGVQIYSRATVMSGFWEQERPEVGSTPAGWYTTAEDLVRLDASELDRVMKLEPGQKGRDIAVGIILHESSHFLDDLGNADALNGFFIGSDHKGQTKRVQTGGDLEGAWTHWNASSERYAELSRNIDDPQVERMFRLSIKNDRSEKEERELHRLAAEVAGRSGAVSGYAAEGGFDEKKSAGRRIGEWWAETLSNYLNPATRARLHQIDPVAYAAAQQYTKAIDAGADPTIALRDAVQYSLSTEISGRQGAALIEKTGPVSAENLDRLDKIAGAYQLHAATLKSWKPFQDDAGLKAMRKGEAEAGVAEGRKLLDKIAERRAALEASGAQGSDEYQRLTRIENKLEKAVDKLEERAAAI